MSYYSKYKVGDEVRILGRGSDESYKGLSYNPGCMDKFIGDVQTVVSLNVCGYPITKCAKGFQWTWHYDWLELIDKGFNPMPEIKAGDDVYHDHNEGNMHNVVIMQTDGSLVIIDWMTYEAIKLDSLNITKVLNKYSEVVWEYKELPKVTPELTMEQLQNKLGYEFKLVKGGK